MMIGDLYWPYVPYLSPFHAMVWEGSEVEVMFNNNKLMDMLAGGKFTISREVNYQILGIGVSICFKVEPCWMFQSIPYYIAGKRS